jgi:hypothetical protein
MIALDQSCSKPAYQGEGSSRFLKKAAQKLLLLWARGVTTSTAQISKVFLLLFVHKKKPSLSLPQKISL